MDSQCHQHQGVRIFRSSATTLDTRAVMRAKLRPAGSHTRALSIIRWPRTVRILAIRASSNLALRCSPHSKSNLEELICKPCRTCGVFLMEACVSRRKRLWPGRVACGSCDGTMHSSSRVGKQNRYAVNKTVLVGVFGHGDLAVHLESGISSCLLL